MSYKEKLIIEKLPRHVAIIMDGNGRWAKKRGGTRIFGHKKGVAAVREVVEAAAEQKIDFLTLYAFSTENWNRPKKEVDALMSLLVITLNKEINTLIKNNVRLFVIGNIESLPNNVQKELNKVIDLTKMNTGLSLIFALSYSSHWEIIEAVKKIGRKIEKGEMKARDINEDIFSNNLSTANFPNPELLIRTSGEYRISNFLLWQLAYTELYFTDKFWPEIRKEDFYEALFDFQNRERRFGKISEQLK